VRNISTIFTLLHNLTFAFLWKNNSVIIGMTKKYFLFVSFIPLSGHCTITVCTCYSWCFPFSVSLNPQNNLWVKYHCSHFTNDTLIRKSK
jgi:hypothetical protein